jgi:hypothetical protein
LTVSAGGTQDAIVLTMPLSNANQADVEAGADYSALVHTPGSPTAEITVNLVTKPLTTSIDRITVESY